jgi:AraC-like DNA-binding protein
MYSTGIKEFVLLPESDCFTLKTRNLTHLDIPFHYHAEFELSLIENAPGGRRIIGHHLGEMGNKDLVLIGPDLSHGWQPHRCRSKRIKETALHFHSNLFGDGFLQRQQAKNFKTLLDNACHGVSFADETIEAIIPLLNQLEAKSGFESLLVVMQIIHILSIDSTVTTLSTATRQVTTQQREDRIERVLEHVRLHFGNPISLKQVAGIANMTEVSFSRFFKQRTGRTFVECVNEIRIDHASRMLADTTNNIAEIAFAAGFNNISNFNRIFKNRKQLTPTQYREVFAANNLYRLCS